MSLSLDPHTRSRPSFASPDMHHRPFPYPRTVTPSPNPSAHPSPLLGEKALAPFPPQPPVLVNQPPIPKEDTAGPTLCGLPLKYVSLVTLAVQNAALSIVMHYSRVSTPPSLSYSPATAVLLNEILKGTISFFVAWWRVSTVPNPDRPLRQLLSDIFSRDCWKLSIPAFLYVVQNSLQFVAIANLPVASFQVTYQMKILTTAAFSVAMLRKRISSLKWGALFMLAVGVGIVQIQTTTSHKDDADTVPTVGSAHEYRHAMSPLKGFGAVTAACFTSGLAGVYFEMVLKNSKADLWVRNVQLSLFSLVPAALPVLATASSSGSGLGDMLRNFGGWAWATVAVQVFGGLVTAIVIKYSDNILKGFATSLSIVLSFLASVALFDFRITPSFLVGASTVLAATWLYNQPAGQEPRVLVNVVSSATGSKSWNDDPVSPSAPILGEYFDVKSSAVDSLAVRAEKAGFAPPSGGFSDTLSTDRYLNAPYGSPMPSRTPSPIPSRPSSRHSLRR
ncbi:nucleotide-sugar transporter-domain-containing protein [Amylostereum chailletii]|nr:nucleotide-sugar transporter-domain-containing protein [Amylostereum chailletii]